MLVASWGKVGDLAIDIGHEVEIPSRLASGQRLYSEVQAYYGPLSYYANALLLVVFGHHLEVFFVIGNLLTLLVTGLVIWLCARLSDVKWAVLCALTILTYCAFRADLSNFILPYSYGAVYGTFFCLVSLLAIDRYAVGRQWRWLIIAAASGALATLSKQEFGVAALMSVLVGVAFALESLKDKSLAWLLVITVWSGATLAGLGCLTIAGVSWEDIFASLLPLGKVAQFSSNSYFQVSPLKSLHMWWDTGKIFFPAFAVVLGIVIAVQRLFPFKELPIWSRQLLQLAIEVVVADLCLWFLQRLVDSSDAIFNPLGYLHWLPPALCIWFIFHRTKIAGSRQEVLLWALLACTLVLNARWLFYIGFYGLYATPAIVLFFGCIFWSASRYRHWLEQAIAVCLCIGISLLVVDYTHYRYAVSSSEGTLYTRNEAQAQAFDCAIQTVKAFKARSVLVLPEGSVLNFFTATRAVSSQTTFLPGVLPTTDDEQQLIGKLNAQPPDLIAYVDRSFTDWGYVSFADIYPQIESWIDHHRLVHSCGVTETRIRLYR